MLTTQVITTAYNLPVTSGTTTTTTTSLLAFPIYIWYCLNKNKVIHLHVISTITKQISGQLN